MFRKYAILVAVLTIGCLLAGNTIRAEEEDDYGKGKGKGASTGSNVIQLDLNKLPPDLAKALMKYAKGGEGKGKPQAGTAPTKGKAPMAKKQQGPPAGKKPGQAAGGKRQLPPGLASKPANHPGRTHFLEHVQRGKVAAPPGKGGPPKGGPAQKGKGKKGYDEEED